MLTFRAALAALQQTFTLFLHYTVNVNTTNNNCCPVIPCTAFILPSTLRDQGGSKGGRGRKEGGDPTAADDLGDGSSLNPNNNLARGTNGGPDASGSAGSKAHTGGYGHKVHAGAPGSAVNSSSNNGDAMAMDVDTGEERNANAGTSDHNSNDVGRGFGGRHEEHGGRANGEAGGVGGGGGLRRDGADEAGVFKGAPCDEIPSGDVAVLNNHHSEVRGRVMREWIFLASWTSQDFYLS